MKNETPREAALRLSKDAIRKGFKLKALYEYRSATGELIYWRIRLESKDGEKHIRPMRCTDSRYVIGEPPFSGEKPLYGLTGLSGCTDVVWIVEGEKCVDALSDIGLTAVTSGSATSAGSADWSPLIGRKCWIWPDNDKAGAAYAEVVAAKLTALGCEVSVVDVSSLDLSEGGDCVDWFVQHQGASRDDLLKLKAQQYAKRSDLPSTIHDALERLTTDAGALFEEAPLRELRELRASNAAAFARVRAAAKSSKQISMQEFDSLTKTGGDDDATDIFPEVEIWPDPVDGAGLLNDMVEAITRFVVAKDATIQTAVLWAVHTWLLDVFTVSPIANIQAPEKRCGKTILLTAIGKLSFRPLQASNVSAAVIFRSIEKWGPTLLIDEADTFLRHNDEARGIINSGHTRESAFVLRTVGDSHEPMWFSTWAPKAISGIGGLADTLQDRSIPLTLKRKEPHERKHNISREPPANWERLRSRIARWVGDHREKIGAARPAPIDGLHDRANDCMEPLLAIAEVAGGRWPELTRAAASELYANTGATESINEELLTDIREILGTQARISTSELLRRLVSDPDAPWATWNRGKEMSGRQLAQKLKAFGIRPKLLRPLDSRNKKTGQPVRGYDAEDFQGVFRSYLGIAQPTEPKVAVTVLQPRKRQGKKFV